MFLQGYKYLLFHRCAQIQLNHDITIRLKEYKNYTICFFKLILISNEVGTKMSETQSLRY